MAPGASWRLLAAAGGCWRLLAIPGGSWWLLAAPLLAAVVPGGPWRLLAVPGGSWRHLAALGGSWRVIATADGSWRLFFVRVSSIFMTICNSYTNIYIYIRLSFNCSGVITLSPYMFLFSSGHVQHFFSAVFPRWRLEASGEHLLHFRVYVVSLAVCLRRQLQQ